MAFDLGLVTCSMGTTEDVKISVLANDYAPEFPHIPVFWDEEDRERFEALQPCAIGEERRAFYSVEDAVERLSTEHMTRTGGPYVPGSGATRGARMHVEEALAGSLRFISTANLLEAHVPLRSGPKNPRTCRTPVRTNVFAFDTRVLPVLAPEEYLSRMRQVHPGLPRQDVSRAVLTNSRRRAVPRPTPAKKRRIIADDSDEAPVPSDAEGSRDSNSLVDDEAEEVPEGQEEEETLPR
jgi:hypothetical protein